MAEAGEGFVGFAALRGDDVEQLFCLRLAWATMVLVGVALFTFFVYSGQWESVTDRLIRVHRVTGRVEAYEERRGWFEVK